MKEQQEKHNRNNKTQKYNTNVQRVVELYPLELSIMKKGTNQQYVEFWPIPFQNDDPTNFSYS